MQMNNNETPNQVNILLDMNTRLIETINALNTRINALENQPVKTK